MGPPMVDGLHAAHHAVRCLHGDAAHASFPRCCCTSRMTLIGDGTLKAVADDLQRLVDGRQVASANCTSTAGPAI